MSSPAGRGFTAAPCGYYKESDMKTRYFRSTLLSIITAAICAHAQSPRLQLLPSSASAPRGGEYSLAVKAMDFPPFRAYTIRVKYDASVLHCRLVKQERYFGEYSTFWFTDIDSADGIAGADESILGVGAVSGDGALFSLVFRVLGEGTARVRFEAYSANDSALKTISPIAVEESMLTVGVEDLVPEARGALSPAAWPNPFAASLDVSLANRASQPLCVRVHSVDGRCVRILHEGQTGRGVLQLRWDGNTADGLPAPPGTYVISAHTRTSAGCVVVSKHR